MLWMSLIVCRVYPTALSGRRWTAIGAVHTRPVAKTWQTLKRIRVCSSAIPQNSRATLHVEPLHRPLVLRPATDWCPRTNGWSNKLEFAPRLFALRNAASTQLEQDNGTTVQRDERSRRGDVYTHNDVHTHPHPHRSGSAVPHCVRTLSSITHNTSGRQTERTRVRAYVHPALCGLPVRSFVRSSPSPSPSLLQSLSRVCAVAPFAGRWLRRARARVCVFVWLGAGSVCGAACTAAGSLKRLLTHSLPRTENHPTIQYFTRSALADRFPHCGERNNERKRRMTKVLKQEMP